MAREYDAPIGGNTTNCLERQERKNCRSAGNALVRNGHKMPEKRRQELEETVASFFSEPFTMELAQRGADLSVKIPRADGNDEEFQQHGKRVVEILTEKGGEAELSKFQMAWRHHFIEKMQPKFMPEDWHDWKELQGKSIH